MKIYKLFTITTLSLLALQCDTSKKDYSNSFSFDSTSFPTRVGYNEPIEVKINNLENRKIDSIVYFTPEKKLRSVIGHENFTVPGANQRLGKSSIKALIYFDGGYAEISKKFEVISKIEPKVYQYEIVNTYPHDSKAYTQGLEFYRGTLYEGTGNGEGVGTGTRGKSSIRKTDYTTGEVLKIVELDDQYFGEGITILNDKLYQLTWTSNVGFVYDINTFEKIKDFKYSKNIQGWGLCNDGEYLYQTDGTSRIWKLNPENLELLDNVKVYAGANEIQAINEIDWVDGKIYGNIYQSNAIAIIDPVSGAIEGVVDLKNLRSLVSQHPDLDVLNGIAYNPAKGTFFVTGKNWDKMFEIKINK